MWYDELKAEHSRVIVRHYYYDEIAWFFLPGGLLLLCGALTWRLAAATEASLSTTPRLVPLAVAGLVVGIVGPACSALLAIPLAAHAQYGWERERAVALSVAAFTAVSWAAMSMLSTIAIVQIRRSDGKLYGLRLALLEALFCPAIVFCCAAFGVLCRAAHGLLRFRTSGNSVPLTVCPDGVRCFRRRTFTYWWLWRKLKRPPDDAVTIGRDESSKVVPPPDRTNPPSPIGRISLWTAIVGLVLPAVLGLIGNLLFRPPEAFFVLNARCGSVWNWWR